MFETLVASDYLDIKSLSAVLAGVIAKQVSGADTEQMRMYFNIGPEDLGFVDFTHELSG